MKVRTRMAPSPTGDLHIGGLRTALYNFAWALKQKGEFVLRIEDTDRERLIEGAKEQILKDLADYGLTWDEGPILQSERLPIYKKHAEELVKKGRAYFCHCSKERLEELRKKQQAEGKLPGYDRHCRDLNLKAAKDSVIRLRVPDNQEIVFKDIVMGEIEVNSSVLDDQVLLKSDGYPTYHLAVVVDDHLMKITHIIRGNEWLSSTPKHILLYQAFEWSDLPTFAHLPVFLNPEGSGKMSKRKGTVSARSFLEAGYLPEAMLNYLMLLGWNPGNEQEVFTLDEFVVAFDLKDLNKSNPKFTYDKLNWFNQQYIHALDDVNLASRLTRFTKQDEAEIVKALPLIKDRLTTLADFDELTSYLWQAPQAAPGDKKILSHASNVLEKDWDGKVLEEKARKFCAENNVKVGEYFMTLRLAITGKTATPPLWDIMEVIGKKETLERLAYGA